VPELQMDEGMEDKSMSCVRLWAILLPLMMMMMMMMMMMPMRTGGRRSWKHDSVRPQWLHCHSVWSSFIDLPR